MKRPLIFVQDPNALKNWLLACGSDSKILYDLENIKERFDPSEVILLVQLSERVSENKIAALSEQQFDILLFSNEPSNTEGLNLFKTGIKGYLNTFATSERIKQALITVDAGSIWLGQTIMNAMIGDLSKQKSPNSDWEKVLTDRELQVVNLVLESKSNREIAQELDITERTVKSHMHNVFEKLEVSDRLALALKIKN
ncbi:MAG: hypothetical protein ISEC1_P1782 [Thiomicrorhabdus sp.]|nr:MAG: hypothetical protein ISEC1_P1782 [Thiomicrorhabdus sp.]